MSNKTMYPADNVDAFTASVLAEIKAYLGVV